MAARVYSDFPERKITHDSGRPSTGKALPVAAPERPAVVWPSGGTSPSPMATVHGTKPKSSGGTFHL